MPAGPVLADKGCTAAAPYFLAADRIASREATPMRSDTRCALECW